mmetsp:Transcript_21614/g.59949  ORF Transcript_21614/g.59949 Transcript_21614/m.59949 type:complete len:214 (+) Transcript_21614:208-849(+)
MLESRQLCLRPGYWHRWCVARAPAPPPPFCAPACCCAACRASLHTASWEQPPGRCICLPHHHCHSRSCSRASKSSSTWGACLRSCTLPHITNSLSSSICHGYILAAMRSALMHKAMQCKSRGLQGQGGAMWRLRLWYSWCPACGATSGNTSMPFGSCVTKQMSSSSSSSSNDSMSLDQSVLAQRPRAPCCQSATQSSLACYETRPCMPRLPVC